MKTIYPIPLPRNFISHVLFAGFALISPSLHAQTFAGRDYLDESPVNLRAFVYPDARKAAIQIRLESLSPEAVRIQIKDEAQKTVYDDYVSKPKYLGRFNVSALPYGVYTVELSNYTVRHTQVFRLEPPATGGIVMTTRTTDHLLAKH